MDLLTPTLTELGTTVAVLVVFVWLMVKLFKPFLDQLMENLRQMNQGYIGYTEAQVQVASSMNALCQRLDKNEQDQRGRDERQDALLAQLVESQQELAGVVRGLQQQQQAHEGRAQKRHEQQVEQGKQQLAQGQELLEALQHLNGKT